MGGYNSKIYTELSTCKNEIYNLKTENEDLIKINEQLKNELHNQNEHFNYEINNLKQENNILNEKIHKYNECLDSVVDLNIKYKKNNSN